MMPMFFPAGQQTNSDIRMTFIHPNHVLSQLLIIYDYLHYTGQIKCENHGCVATLCFFTFHFQFYVVKKAELRVQLGLGTTNSACFGLNTCIGRHRHSLKLSRGLLKNMQSHNALKCRNAVLNCGHWLIWILDNLVGFSAQCYDVHWCFRHWHVFIFYLPVSNL